MNIFKEMKKRKWIVSLMSNRWEYEYLLRNMPQDKVKQHILGDDEDIKQLFNLLGVKGDIQPEIVSSALRGLFVMLLHTEELGEEIDDAFLLLLKGIAIQVFEGEIK